MPVGIGTPAVDGLTNGQTNWGPSVKADIDALNGQFLLAAINTYRPGSASALSSLTGMRAGDYAVRTDTGVTYRYNGSTWQPWESTWASYIPNGSTTTIGNFGAGSSVVQFYWRYVGGEVEIRGQVALGTGGLSGTDVYFDVPAGVAANTLNGTFDLIGQAYFVKNGGSTYGGGIVGFYTTTRVFIKYGVVASGGGPEVMTSLTSSTPFTWASGDVLFVRIRYTPA